MKTTISLLLAVIWLAGINLSVAAESDLSKLAAANNAFAFKLIKQLSVEQPAASIFVSPYSAATALQMTSAGAGGPTKSEMRRVLETSGLSAPAFSTAYGAASEILNATQTNAILSTANALWYRERAQIKSSFLAENQKLFFSTIKPLDFSNPAKAEAEINKWASDQTHGRITGIADGVIDPRYTDLFLANAIYFKGKWLEPFDAKLTKERPFHPAAGAPRNLPMMEMSKKFNYRKGSGYQAVRLPYIGDDLAMYVFLPDPDSGPGKLLQIMNGDNWRRVTVPGFSERNGLLVLPKFRLENTLELNAPLKTLGIKLAFNNNKADFSGMFSDRHFISEVRQKAFVEVSEEGTEAAAVTAMLMEHSASFEENPPKPFQMIVDRPFLFVIVEARSEIILFMGVVNTL